MSEKAVSEATDIKLAKEFLDKIKEGDIYDAVVTTVASFGCFVRLDVGKEAPTKVKKSFAPEGLVHVSELSWSKVENVSDAVKIGDKVKVKVIGTKDGKLSLSVKRAKVDPWTKAGDKYHVDTKYEGKVVKISDFGIFVELEPGVEGLIHITKIPPATRLREGEKINCIVEEIDAKSKKMSLGLVLSSKPIGYK